MRYKLPEGWKIVKLGEICKEDSGIYGINESAVNYSESLYRYLRITDIKDDGTIDEDKKASVNIKKGDDSKYLLKKNDIVFARTGASVGRNYFYNGNEEPMIYAGFLIKFAVDEKKFYLNIKILLFIKYYSWINAVKTGSTRPNINAIYKNMD